MRPNPDSPEVSIYFHLPGAVDWARLDKAKGKALFRNPRHGRSLAMQGHARHARHGRVGK